MFLHWFLVMEVGICLPILNREMTDYILIVLNASMISTLVLTFMYAIDNKRNYSVLTTIVLAVLADLLIMYFSPLTRHIDDLHIRNFAWFIGIAFFNVVTVYAIVLIHTSIGLMFTTFAKLVISVYLGLAFVQILTYFDKIHFKTQTLPPIYQVLIPSVSIAGSVGISLYLFYLLFRTKFNNRVAG